MGDGVQRRQARERRAWLVVAALLVLPYVPSRFIPIDYADTIGDFTGYLSIFWLGFVVLMPTMARLGKGPMRRLMAVRKQLGMGAGFSVVIHGLFAWLITNSGDVAVLNPAGRGSGYVNFFLAIVLLITSINRVRRKIPRRWWTLLQRTGTFAMLFLGTTACIGSEHAVAAQVGITFTSVVFAVRLAHFVIDRHRHRRRDILTNAVALTLTFAFLTVCFFSGEFPSVLVATLLLGGVVAFLWQPRAAAAA